MQRRPRICVHVDAGGQRTEDWTFTLSVRGTTLFFALVELVVREREAGRMRVSKHWHRGEKNAPKVPLGVSTEAVAQVQIKFT